METTNTPAIRGLFKKNSDICNNGWCNCTLKKVRQLRDKIERGGTGFKQVGYRKNDCDGYIVIKYEDTAGNIVYLFAVGGGEIPIKRGTEWEMRYGNVNIYRGGTKYYDDMWERYNK